jgi:hypothetical protein
MGYSNPPPPPPQHTLTSRFVTVDLRKDDIGLFSRFLLGPAIGCIPGFSDETLVVQNVELAPRFFFAETIPGHFFK